MTDLAWFLLERFAEDAEVFREQFGSDASPGTWLRWGLDESEAKRRIVALHRVGPMQDHYEYGCTCCYHEHRWSECEGCGYRLNDVGELDRGIRNRSCPTLSLLALPYAGHPDYRDEWRPE